MLNINKKGSTPIAILIFTVFLLTLYDVAWRNLLDENSGVQLQIYSSSILERTYAKESQINSQLGYIVAKSAKGISNSQNPEEQFIQNMKTEIEKYKLQNAYLIPEFEEILPQINSQNIEINSNTASLKLKIKIDESLKQERLEIISTEYIYEKEFKAKIQ